MEKKVIAGSYTGPKDREAYKLGYKKKSVPPFVKRIAVSWLVFLIVGVMLGVGITAACLHRTNPDGEGEEQIVEAPPVYGTRDGHVYVSVSASDWDIRGAGAAFVPLDCGLSEELQEYTYFLCKAYYLDYPLVMAVMNQESNYRTKVVSADGHDFGLMQIRDVNNESLQKAIGVSDMLDPYQNIHAGIFILRGLFERYDDPARVLMCYNCGEYGASVLWEKGITETEYVRKVFATADKYAAEIESNK